MLQSDLAINWSMLQHIHTSELGISMSSEQITKNDKAELAEAGREWIRLTCNAANDPYYPVDFFYLELQFAISPSEEGELFRIKHSRVVNGRDHYHEVRIGLFREPPCVQNVLVEIDVLAREVEPESGIFRIVSGSVNVSADDLFVGDLKTGFWADGNDKIKEIGFSERKIDLKIQVSDDATYAIRHIPDRDKTVAAEAEEVAPTIWRFWEVVSCCGSSPTAVIERDLSVLDAAGSVRLIRNANSVPRVIFQSGQGVTKVLAPAVTLEFELPDQPRWTPTRLIPVDNTFTFSNRSIFDTDDEAIEKPFRIAWDGTGDVEVTVPELPLTGSTLPDANRSEMLWQYGVQSLGEESSPLGWIGYPLPVITPTHRSTQPSRLKLTSRLDVAFSIGGQSDWHLVATPLANATIEGGIAVKMTVEHGMVTVAVLGDKESFDLQLSTPAIFAYGNPLTAPQAVPAPVRPTSRLADARLLFQNVPEEGWASPLHVTLQRDASLFEPSEPIRMFRHTGRALIHPVSPAGRNALVDTRNSDESAESLPDSSRGLVEFIVQKNTSFSLIFPESEPASVKETFGGIALTESPSSYGAKAIDPRFPWMTLQWADNSAPSENPNTVGVWSLHHRSMLAEINEFFRRKQDTAAEGTGGSFNWEYDTIISLMRDKFSLAAEFQNGVFDEKRIENFFPNADVDGLNAPKVRFEDGDWPVATAVTDANNHTLKAYLTTDGARTSRWLAYDANVEEYTNPFPKIAFTDRENQKQSQSLIADGTEIASITKVYDNAGVVRRWGNEIIVGSEAWPTLRLQEIYYNHDHIFYALDLNTQLADGIHLFCTGLILDRSFDEELEEWVFTPVNESDKFTAGLGDFGNFRITCKSSGNIEDNSEQKLGQRIRDSWPLIDGVSVVPFDLDRIHLTIVPPTEQAPAIASVARVVFQALLPSPRDIAFPEPTEFSTNNRRALQEEAPPAVLTCTVTPTPADIDSSVVAAEGRFSWFLPNESPETLSQDSVDTGDGPRSVRGIATFGPNPAGVKMWMLTGVEVSINVLGLSMPNVEKLNATLTVDGEYVIFESTEFAGQGERLWISSDPALVPQYLFNAVVDRRYIELRGAYQNRVEDGGVYERRMSIRLVQEGEPLILKAIVDSAYGFIGSQDALIVWREDDKLKYRRWSESAAEEKSAVLWIGADDLNLVGVRQDFTISHSDGGTEKYISWYLEHLANECNPDNVRILITSQSPSEDGDVTAQFSIDYDQYRPCSSDQEAACEDVVGEVRQAGTMRLQLGEGILTLSNDVYDRAACDLVENKDRTNDDVRLPISPRKRCTDTGLNLVNVTAEPHRGAEFFQWAIGPASSLLMQDFPDCSIAINRAPSRFRTSATAHRMTATKCESESEGNYSGSCNLEATENGAPREDVGARLNSETPVVVVSSKGAVFVVDSSLEIGYLYQNAEGNLSGTAQCVRFDKTSIVAASFSGDILLVATEGEVFQVADGEVTSIFTDVDWKLNALEVGSFATQNVLIGLENETGYQIRSMLFSGGVLVQRGYGRYWTFPHFLVGWGRYDEASFVIVRHGDSQIESYPVGDGGIGNQLDTLSLRRHQPITSACVDDSNRSSLAISYGPGEKSHTHVFDVDQNANFINDRFVEIARPHAIASWSQSTLVSGQSSSKPNLVVYGVENELFADLRQADKVVVKVVEPGFMVAITIKWDPQPDVKLDVRVDRFVSSRIGGRRIPDSEVPLDRCTDGDVAKPPASTFLTVPQLWHHRAAGPQLLSELPDAASFQNQGKVADTITVPDGSIAKTWIGGPLMYDSTGLAIFRTNLYVAPRHDPASSEQFRTDSLFALSRHSGTGVLLNQTQLNSTSNTARPALLNAFAALLKRRGWNGLTLKRTLLGEGSEFAFLGGQSRSRNSGKPTSDRNTRPRKVARTATANAPDNRILPYDEWIKTDVLNHDAAEDCVFIPIGIPIPSERKQLPGDSQDLRRWTIERTTGILPQCDDRLIEPEFLIGEVTATKTLPRRVAATRQNAKDKTPVPLHRPFLPASIDIIHGAGKPGAMISERIQTAFGDELRKKYAPATTVALRDPIHLAQPNWLHLSDGLASVMPVIFRDHRRVTGLQEIHASWKVSYQPLIVDNDEMPLNKPTETGRFITKDGDTYEFKDNNRRIFALVNTYSGRLVERPQFKKSGDVIRRDASDGDQFVAELRDSRSLVPSIFLVTRIPEFEIAKQVIDDDDVEFEVMVEFHDSEKSTEQHFDNVFELVTPSDIDGQFLWKPKTDDALWNGVERFQIFLRSIEGRIYPWAKASTDVSSPLEYKPLPSQVADPTQSVIVGGEISQSKERKKSNELRRRNVLLTFDHVPVDWTLEKNGVSRNETHRLEALEEDVLSLLVADEYAVRVESGVVPALVQVACNLPHGECLGINLTMPEDA